MEIRYCEDRSYLWDGHCNDREGNKVREWVESVPAITGNGLIRKLEWKSSHLSHCKVCSLCYPKPSISLPQALLLFLLHFDPIDHHALCFSCCSPKVFHDNLHWLSHSIPLRRSLLYFLGYGAMHTAVECRWVQHLLLLLSLLSSCTHPSDEPTVRAV